MFPENFSVMEFSTDKRLFVLYHRAMKGVEICMTAQEKVETGKRPGVMIYFDMVEPILALRDSEKGRILMAIVEYARNSTEPKFDGKLAMAWGYIKPRLDRDALVYENTLTQRKYAAFCKKRGALKLPKIPFEQWQEMSQEERQKMTTGDNETQRADDAVAFRYPTGNGKGYGDGNGNGYGDVAVDGKGNRTGAAGFAAAAAERKLKRMNGVLGQGVVNLTDQQTEVLLEEMGLEMFDYYVKKLSDFILKNGASVKNHYETILRWWRQDNAL